MAESSQTSFSFNYHSLTCHCEIPSELQTSWTEANPGRRFYGCGRYKAENDCNFFKWYDPSPPERFWRVINGLLRKSNTLHEEIEALQRKNNALIEEIEEQVVEIYVLHETIELQTIQLWKLRLLLLSILMLIIGFYFYR